MKILGHRGINQPENSDLPYQNTIEAFQYALSKGADGVELDVMLSNDGKCFVIHDNDISKHGTEAGFISQMNSDEIRKKSVGKNRKYNIPALTDVFILFKGKNKLINIEIKQKEIAEKVLMEVLNSGIPIKDFLISSFDHHDLFKVRGLNKDIKVGLLFGRESREDKNFERQILELAERLKPAVFNMEKSLPYLAVLDNKIDKFIWTIKKEDLTNYQVEGLMLYESINFITDYPEELLRRLKK